MGNVVTGVNKAIECVKQCRRQSIPFYVQQQAVRYSEQVGEKCLQYLIDLNYSSYDSFKRSWSYIQPALQQLRFYKQNQEDNKFLKIREESIINSSGYILKIYMNFLEKVVPANVSYFHFMREKDLYNHLTALRYVIEAGYINQAYDKKTHIFSNLSTEINHWLYDMVKYYCSILYIESETIPHLINTLSAILYGLLQDTQQKTFQNIELPQQLLIYQRSMYSFTHLLCLSNKQNSFHNLQMVLHAITCLISKMYRDPNSSKQVSCCFAPSYWFVEEIGFIQHPYLQKICFIVVIDLIMRKQRKSQMQIKLEKQKIEEEKKKSKRRARKKRNKEKGYSNFEDEDVSSHINLSPVISNRNKNQNYVLTQVTILYAYNLLLTCLEFLPKLGKTRVFQSMMKRQISNLGKSSLYNPFIIRMIELMLQATGELEKQDAFLTRPGWQQIQNQGILKLDKTLIEYHKDHKTNYYMQSWVISNSIVGKNLRIFLNNMCGEIMEKSENQISKKQQQIWKYLVKYNQHQFQQNEK